MPRTALGPVFSAGLFGAMVGALLFGPLGDRFGRKRMLVAAAAIFGVFTVLTATAASLPWLVTVRFLAGIGLAAPRPASSRWRPSSRRAAAGPWWRA